MTDITTRESLFEVKILRQTSKHTRKYASNDAEGFESGFNAGIKSARGLA